MTRLRVGLLECDHTADALRGIAGDYRDMFRALFAAHAPEVELVPFDLVAGELPDDLDACDGWLSTGSRASVTDDDAWIAAFRELVATLHAESRPFVGVCFGHQMIATALGGRVGRAPAGWGIGVHAAEVVEHEPWMQPPVATLRLLVSHQDQVVELPPGGRVLAKSDFCQTSLFLVGETSLGIQAHPEFTARYARALMDSRADRIPAPVLEAARATLAGPTDEAVVAAWIVRFLAERA